MPTFALGAALLSTELKTALECRKLQALSPYKLDAWERALAMADPNSFFRDIPDGLRYGFIVSFPNIPFVQSPANSPSVITYNSELENIVQKRLIKVDTSDQYPSTPSSMSLDPSNHPLFPLFPSPVVLESSDSYKTSLSPSTLPPSFPCPPYYLGQIRHRLPSRFMPSCQV